MFATFEFPPLLPPRCVDPGDQESCRHSVDSQGSAGIPRKQMRVEHFSTAAQHLDCGFDRHHYPSDSFSSTSSSKAEQVAVKNKSKVMFTSVWKQYRDISVRSFLLFQMLYLFICEVMEILSLNFACAHFEAKFRPIYLIPVCHL